MAISKDTEAIIERLKMEGLNTRNKGTNSIKSVKDILLNNLAPALDSMREAMTGMAVLNTADSEYNKAKAEEMLELEKLSREEQDAWREQQALNTKKQQELDTKDLEAREKAQKERDKKDLKIFGKDGLLIQGIRNTFKIALIGAVAAIGYSFISGFLEGAFPDTFGPKGDFGEIPSVFDIFRGIAKVFKSVDYDQLAQNIGFLSSGEFMGALTAAATTFGALKLLGITKDAITTMTLAQLFMPGAGAMGASSLGVMRHGVRVALAGVIFMALEHAIPAFVSYFKGSNEFTPEALKNVNPGPFSASTQLTNVAQAATIAMLFSPTGGVGMAIAGFVTWLTLTALDVFEHNKDKDRYSNAFEGLLDNEALDVAEQKANIAALEKAIDTGRISDEYMPRALERLSIMKDNLVIAEQKLIDKTTEVMEAQVDIITDTAEITQEEIDKQRNVNKAKNLGTTMLRGGVLSFADMILRGFTGRGFLNRYSEDDLDIMLELAMAKGERQSIAKEQILQQVKDYPDAFSSVQKKFKDDFGIDIPDVKALEQHLESYRTGTYGFKDFGQGTLALLHGEEAIIPRGSLEGQILEGLRSGSTIGAMSDKIALAMQSGGMGNMVINNVNNSSNPITVQSSQGGARVAHTKIGGGGGGMGGSYIDMPGLIG
jgi:hypothetical protein